MTRENGTGELRPQFVFYEILRLLIKLSPDLQKRITSTDIFRTKQMKLKYASTNLITDTDVRTKVVEGLPEQVWCIAAFEYKDNTQFSKRFSDT